MTTDSPSAFGGPHICVGVDGSAHADEALLWAAAEASARGLGLRIIHAWLPLLAPGGRAVGHTESRRILDEAESRARALAPEVPVSTREIADLVGSALAAESETAAMLVLGSRGRGGFRSLLLGSSSLTAAAVSRCPVVIVRSASQEPEDPGHVRDIVVGVDERNSADDILMYAFEAAAAHPGTRLRIVHAWTMGDSALAGGPVFDEAAVESAVSRTLAEIVAGWNEKYPQVPVMRTTAHASPAKALVEASAHARLTVVGRRTDGTSLGLRLGPVAHAVLLHAHGPVAVVPY